jgi:hypothetical protein
MLDFPAPRSAVTSDRRLVTLRPITCEDRNALRAFHQTLSPHTVYLRYFGSHPRLSEADLDLFTDVDGHRRMAIIALDGQGRIVAVGRYMAPKTGGPTAELAFVVTDAWQGVGLYGLLYAELFAAAERYGIAEFTADVLSTNTRMMRILTRDEVPTLRGDDGRYRRIVIPIGGAAA